MAENENTCPHCSDPCISEDGIRTTQRADDEKKKLLARCNRVEGQIRGIRGMIERDIYCDDILNQIAAAQSALSALSRVLLEHHLKSCVVSRIQTEDMAVLDELLTTFGKLMR